MEEKKLDYKYKMIIGLLIFSIIGVGVAYLIADQLAIKLPEENVQNGEVVDDIVTCEYDVLPNPTNLTVEEKTEIIELLSRNNSNMEIDIDSVKIDIIDKHTYSVEFEYVKKEGSYALKDIVWKKNGKWENYGAGSDFLPEQYENVHLNICTSCSDDC